jgi:hypothetical protein
VRSQIASESRVHGFDGGVQNARVGVCRQVPVLVAGGYFWGISAHFKFGVEGFQVRNFESECVARILDEQVELHSL